MKKLLPFLLSIFLLPITTGAVTATDQASDETTFFRLRSDKKKTFYMLGTRHDLSYGTLSAPVKKQIASLSHLVAEKMDDLTATLDPSLFVKWDRFLDGNESSEQKTHLRQICQHLTDLDGFLNSDEDKWLDLTENAKLLAALIKIGANTALCRELKIWALHVYLGCKWEWDFFPEDTAIKDEAGEIGIVSARAGMDSKIAKMPNFSKVIGLETAKSPSKNFLNK